MLPLPRLAVGAVQPSVDTQPACWGLMSLVSHQGHRVQHFHSTACFPRWDGAPSATGISSRHLDSWLMTPEVCREVFAHGADGTGLAVVEGRYAPAREAGWRGGKLDQLCDWLDLPRVVVLDVTHIDGCCVPPRPPQADALILDNVRDLNHVARLQTTLESLWSIPVLGALETLTPLRAAIARLPRGAAPSKEICHDLATNLARYLRLGRLRELACRRDFPTVRPFVFKPTEYGDGRKLTVAVAFDDAFRCYFPDTLELLELAGATVVDFSPLRDESLPADADLVYLGCGHPERYAAALAENHCMLFALREHVCAGRRIYAEGGGMAYLCEHIVTPEGERLPMVGALPLVAAAHPRPTPPIPVAVTLAGKSWLGRPGTTMRGYLNSNFLFEPSGPLVGLVAQPGHERDLVGRYLAVGSRMHLNFVSQPEVLASFLRPACEALSSI